MKALLRRGDYRAPSILMRSTFVIPLFIRCNNTTALVNLTIVSENGVLSIIACVSTKKASEVERILEACEKAQTHIWTFRTPKEAERFWNQHYGHLYDDK